MARFTNQAQLRYGNEITNSNIAVGEITEVLSATKTAVRDTYGPVSYTHLKLENGKAYLEFALPEKIGRLLSALQIEIWEGAEGERLVLSLIHISTPRSWVIMTIVLPISFSSRNSFSTSLPLV